jgi:hypothetical protein
MTAFTPLTVVSLLCASVIAASAPQTTTVPRDARAVARGTATIAGVVLTDDSDARPVRHARVTLRGAEPFGGLTTVTDDRGRFAFMDLPAGRFELTASKDGWVSSAYGAKRPLRPGTSIPVREGQKVDLTFRLLHGAAITGIVLDNMGQPSIGTTVRAMRYSTITGERRLSPSRASAITDDRGIYRISGLPPGDYVVGAWWRPGFFATKGDELRITTDLDVRHARSPEPSPVPPDRTVALASTFYPGTTAPAQAAVLTIRPAEERTGVDFTLQVVPTARVEGTITLPTSASVPTGVQVTLMATGQMLFPGIPYDGYRTTGTGADGSFAFSDVSPGRYTLVARASLPSAIASGRATSTENTEMLWASTDLSIDGDSISGLSLMLTPGITMTGRVRFESSSVKPPADLRAAKIALQPVQAGDSVSVTPSGASVEADGRFTMTGITPGRYRLTATFPGSSRWVVRSAIVDGIDTLDVPIVIQPNQNVANAAITFIDRPSQLTGRLENAAGGAAPEYSIVLFPDDQTLWTPQSRRIQSVRPAVDGGFTFANIPAGTYQLVAVDDIEPGEWYDPAILRQLIASSMKVSITEGEKRVQNVRIGR